MWKLVPLAAMMVVALVAFTSGSSPPASAGIFLPPGGTDEFEINGQVTIDLSPIGQGTEKIPLTGSMTWTRTDPVAGTIDVEIVALSLTGDSMLFGKPTPVEVALNPNAPPSIGQIDASSGFPAESFFDIYFPDVFIGPFGHFADELPLSMTSQITGIPPYGDKFDSGPTEHPLHDSLNPSSIVGTMSGLSIDIKPPPKLYTITVLKRHGETKEGLPGWEINLYAGLGCIGSPIDSGLTDSDGLIEFGGLAIGIYSVEEKLQPGWNAEGPLCKEAAAGVIVLVPLGRGSPAPAGVALVCPISPNLPFPDPGCDEFSSVATVKVELTNPPVGDLTCDLSGPTVITRGPVENKPPDSIDTEIVAMQLEGTCQPGNIAVTVRESATQASTGRIIEQNDSIPGTLEFPADSFFDVFFEIDTPIGTLHNSDPLTIRCKIDEIPPYGCFYEPDVGQVQLYDETEKKAGSLIHAAHIPIDPKKVLVVFVNVPKPPNVVGDVDCDGVATIVDAQLIAQLIIGRIEALDCDKNADVNDSGDVTIADAQIIAQFVVGRIPSLPPP